jgi:tripartite-type tricarboxylate transporter receptor subunit TctC
MWKVIAIAVGASAIALGLSTSVLRKDPGRSTAQFPERPIRLVVPFPPGGAADMLARLLADGLGKHWAHPVVLDYRPGGGTIVGTDQVAKAAPDGYTLGLVVTSFVVHPAVRDDLPYDTIVDFRGITQIGEAPVVLLASPGFPGNSVDDLVRRARAEPGRVAYASPGVGTATHMAGELLARLAGVELLHVPYAGLAAALPDVLSGRVPLLFDIWHSARPHIEAGSLRVIAAASPHGVPGHPEFARLPDRFPGFSASSIQGVVTPAGTPDPVVEAISDKMRRVIRSPEVQARMDEFGMRGIGSAPTEFDRFLTAEIERWMRVAEEAGISIHD